MSMTKAEAFEVFRYYASKEFDNIPKNDSEINYEFSDKFNAKMDKLLKKVSYNNKHSVPLSLKKALVAVAAMIITVAGLLSIKAVRKPTVEFVYNVYEKFAEIVFDTQINDDITEEAEIPEQTTSISYDDKFIIPTQPYYVNGTTAPNTHTVAPNKRVTKPPLTTVPSTTKKAMTPENFTAVVFQKGDLYYVDDKYYIEHFHDYEAYSSPPPMPYFYTENRPPLKKDETEIRFSYGGKDWLIVSSKHTIYKKDYYANSISAETIIMTAPEGTGFTNNTINNFEKYIPSENDWLKTQFEVFDKENSLLFKIDYAKHWWANGYIIHDIENPDDMTVKNKITFKDEEMAKLFAEGLIENGFNEIQHENDLVIKTYYINGSEVIYII